jgi:hypothetical protein
MNEPTISGPTGFFDLLVGCDGWDGVRQDYKLSWEEEQQQPEDGGPWFRQRANKEM